MKDNWIKLIEELEKEGITPKEAKKMIRGYQMVNIVMNTVKDIEPNQDEDPWK